MAERYRIVRLARAAIPPIDLEQARLAPLGAEVVGAIARTEDEAVAALEGVDGVITVGVQFTKSVIDRLDRLWIIAQAATGYDAIDVEAATERGIMVANLPFQCLHEVANTAIAYVLALNRKIVVADRRVRAGNWDRASLQPIGTLYGETLGLLSFGNIARATARKAQALDMNVIAHDPFVDPSIAREHGVELVSLEDLCRRSDYISCHAPLNRHTEKMMGEAQFRSMKPTAYFVNTARGRIVDEPALIRALQEGWIAGAGLDVFEIEPLPIDSPLISLENVILAPHLAGTSVESVKRNRSQAIDQMEDALRTGRPSGLVNPTVTSRRPIGT
jgi:D-3-phosphoglycerate dehydrogenase / 2-oxoglutarate reductase